MAILPSSPCVQMPLAVPIDRWFIWPPPMNCPPAAFGPLGVYWIFFKFYDLLAKFSCPPSFAMSKSRLLREFPQLSHSLKYAMVFYEGQHNDSRTNIAIALTAAENGATVLNHAEVAKLHKAPGGDGTVSGAVVRDLITNEEITIKLDSAFNLSSLDKNKQTISLIFSRLMKIRCKSVVMCGGPFTDELRDMEDEEEGEGKEKVASKVINGAAGTHVVLPGYLCPRNCGMVDMATSDGRILFYLPWEGHTLVGTTDVKCDVTDRPIPTEEEIDWIIGETNNYLTPECQVTRKDVLSAWSGIRPLAVDPHADPNAPASRDHVVSVNPKTKAVFVAGGKWTTYREMAEDAIDNLLQVHPDLAAKASSCKSLSVPLLGAEGYCRTLPIQLSKSFNLPIQVCEHLARDYGGRAADVCALIGDAVATEEGDPRLLAAGYPYLKAEVRYACREHARTVEDIISRRTRLAYLNVKDAQKAIPIVAEIMAEELRWNVEETQKQMVDAAAFLDTFAGPEPAIATTPAASKAV
eukprot:jgi/Bigna1/89985/estExt_fgenesh1_pg.C_590113